MSGLPTIITNPKAASGKAIKALPHVIKALEPSLGQCHVRHTQGPFDAARLAQEAIREGSRLIIAVGGDGTIHEVVNGVLAQNEVSPENVLLAHSPTGTGNDLGRTLGIPKSPLDLAALLRRGQSRLIDAAEVVYEVDGEPRNRWFVNMAGMGYNAIVAEAVNRKKAAGNGGALSYMGALVGCLMRYKAIAATVEAGDYHQKTKVFSLVVGNGRFNGGGMMQAPNARPDDGQLDLTLIRKIGKGEVIANVPRLFNGKFVRHRKVDQARSPLVRIHSDGMPLEADGEWLGTIQGTVEFRLKPSCLRFVAEP